MRFGLSMFIASLVLPFAVAAQTAGNQVALATYQGMPYDVAANCLMKEMRTDQIMAWPTVDLPPRTEAIVNLWYRGREYEPPIATFHIKQVSTGSTTVGFEEAAGGRLDKLARAAVQRCSK